MGRLFARREDRTLVPVSSPVVCAGEGAMAVAVPDARAIPPRADLGREAVPPVSRPLSSLRLPPR